ncbi:MAG: FadR family transcriptional regulator [Spirochaetales bacterium]|nr:FadR family transcriptional regulator [Spirochaetales bacterium]
MEFKNLNNLSLKDLFVKEIESMIISNKLPIGSKLPPERQLAKDMGICKTAVNSGIAEMANKGFLEIKPRQGTYVANYKKYGKIDVILSIMDYNYGLLSQQDIKSFLEMRILLERLAFSSAIPNITDPQIKTLEEMLIKLKESKDNKEAAERNYEIHHEICYISGNTIAPLIFSSFKIPIINMWKRYCEIFGLTRMIENAEKIHFYIKKRDANSAIKTLEEAIDDAFGKM